MIISWILLLLVTIPILTIFGNLFIIQSTLAQTELPSTELTQEKIQSLKSNQEKLLSIQKGFSVSVLTTNLSSPYNILYGPMMSSGSQNELVKKLHVLIQLLELSLV